MLVLRDSHAYHHLEGLLLWLGLFGLVQVYDVRESILPLIRGLLLVIHLKIRRRPTTPGLDHEAPLMSAVCTTTSDRSPVRSSGTDI